MLDEKEKNEVLAKVLKSKLFTNSPSLNVLLKFLVQSTINGVDIKESVIGIHVFGENYDDEKSNARIRVSVYHLRKKLNEYYNTEGLNDKWRLHIEKGQYLVTFVSNKAVKPDFPTSYSKKVIATLSVGLLILLVLLTAPLVKFKPKVWKTYFTNNKETTLFIGDVFGFMGKTSTGGWGWQRDYNINSLNDFYKILENENLNDTGIKAADYTYITFMSAEATRLLTKFFNSYDAWFSVRRVSKIDINTLKEQNCIYVGPIKNNNIFVHILEEQHKEFVFQNNQLFFKAVETDTLRNLYLSGEKAEIAVVSRLSGANETEQMLFFADHDMGLSATVDYFTNEQKLKKFTKEYLGQNGNFTAIFKVKGRDRVDLELELLSVWYPR